jgi:hypothetical protein
MRIRRAGSWQGTGVVHSVLQAGNRHRQPVHQHPQRQARAPRTGRASGHTPGNAMTRDHRLQAGMQSVCRSPGNGQFVTRWDHRRRACPTSVQEVNGRQAWLAGRVRRAGKRLLLEPEELGGIRFGTVTTFDRLDLDRHSRQPNSWRRALLTATRNQWLRRARDVTSLALAEWRAWGRRHHEGRRRQVLDAQTSIAKARVVHEELWC